MSDFLLEKICEYLRKGKIQIKFREIQCIEKDIHQVDIYKRGKYIRTFKLTRGDKQVIEFVIEMEELVDAVRC